ncbi:hypothetical protein [Sulfuracidifex metallicus]|nr:hypothetical protein [Sulfuracidifex metallicus]
MRPRARTFNLPWRVSRASSNLIYATLWYRTFFPPMLNGETAVIIKRNIS